MYSNIIDQKLDFNNKNQADDEIIFLDDSRTVGYDPKTGELLIKQNDWQGKKINSVVLAYSYKRIYVGTAKANKYLNVLNCSTYLEFRRYVESQERRLHSANFCKDRLCPICNWRRSKKVFSQAGAVMKKAVNDYEFLFLTLTQKNVKGDDLKDEIDKMMEGFRKLTRKKEFKNAFKGFFRALEITYNKKRDDFHPHFHVILAVNKSYAKSKFYLKQKDIVALWRNCMGLDYDPVIDIRKFKTADGKELSKSLAEATKYTVKDADYIIKNKDGEINYKRTDRVVKYLSEALAYRRLIAWGGVLKDIYKSLNLDDPEKGDLVVTGDEDSITGLYIIEKYHWSVGMQNYVLMDIEQK